MSKFIALRPSTPEKSPEEPHRISFLEEMEPRLGDCPPEEISRIRTVLRRLIATRVDNPEDAEDLVQETFLTMTEKYPQVDLEKGLLVWSMGILRKKVGNYYRRVRPPVSLDDELHGRQLARTAETHPSPEAALRHSELRGLIDRILVRLPPAEEAALRMVADGYSTGEIARDCRAERYQNIVNRLHRGRRKLSRELAKRGYPVDPVTSRISLK